MVKPRRTRFSKCFVENGINVRIKTIVDLILLILCVDCLLITRNDLEEIEVSKGENEVRFERKNVDELTYFLGMNLVQIGRKIMLQQKRCMNEVLKRFNMVGCNIRLTSTKANIQPIKYEEGKLVNNTFY